MSSDIVIRTSGAGKCFQTYDRPAHRLMQALYRDRKKLYEEFWALKGVTIDVQRGETLGIIGSNGSGKSTLLQLIAGTLTPTIGSVHTAGRISAILELGAGFNPEFTGIENARLNAAILGMQRDEIDARLGDIIAFSELGDFIERPVKTYSSGMYIRLAFSISINLEPDILIIDEALAVGDVKFQRKCFRKLEEMRNAGVTTLFVTHATESVISLCDRALLLDGGEVKAIGDPKHVVNRYLETMFFPHSQGAAARGAQGRGDALHGKPLVMDPDEDSCKRRMTYNGSEFRWGSRSARIVDYVLSAPDGREIGTGCNRGETAVLAVAVYFEKPARRVVYGLTIKTIGGAAVFGTNSEMKQLRVREKQAGEFSVVEFRFSTDLVAGEYFISLGVVDREDGAAETILDRRYDLIHLKIEDERPDAFGIAAVDMTMVERPVSAEVVQ